MSCLGFRKAFPSDEQEPLLPQYQDDTTLQRQLHEKLHSYQMYRALAQGFMPSNEQLIINLRTLLASNLLNPTEQELTDSGRLLVKYTKQWLKQFIELLSNKNSKDQIQDFLWFLSKARVSVDVDDLSRRAQRAQSQASTRAAYESFRTVGSLLLTNSDFRIFLADLNTIGREVFKDSAFTLSEVAASTAKQIEPSQEEQRALKQPGEEAQSAPTTDELATDVTEVTQTAADATAAVARTAQNSLAEKLTGDEKDTLIYRLKQAITRLRQRNDYNASASILGDLVKRYALIYSRIGEEALEAASDDVHENEALDRAFRNAWSFVTSFGDQEQWAALESNLQRVMKHKEANPQFESFMGDIGDSVHKLLTDPSFIDNIDAKIKELQKKTTGMESDPEFKKDVDALLQQADKTLRTVAEDKDVNNLLVLSTKLWAIISPPNQINNNELIHDSINTFVPALLNAVQYIPIPRIELSTPNIDLLLENLILEPGKTVNHTSFLPFRFRAETYNNFEIRKARVRTVSRIDSTMTIKIDGLTLRADEIGFWMRAHSGFLRFIDQGIASFALDERGIDIHLDVEIGRERLEHILTLKAVRVHVHKLKYEVRQSKFAWLGWVLKPFLQPAMRKVMEKQLAEAIGDLLHAANRELLYARERLRATRISDPDDLLTFIRAVAARLQPEDDPDVYSRVGIEEPGKGVFRGKYAPGSVVKLWRDEAVRASERIEDQAERYDGWRNDVFDVHVRTMG